MVKRREDRHPSVLTSVSLDGEELERLEFTWAWDDEPDGVPENLQRWIGPHVSLSSRTVRSTAPLEELVADHITGELLNRAMAAAWPKPETGRLLESARGIRPSPADAALIIDGHPVPGVTASLKNALGSFFAAAGSSRGDVVVVMHDAGSPLRASVSLSAPTTADGWPWPTSL